jgi:hypothetical protein
MIVKLKDVVPARVLLIDRLRTRQCNLDLSQCVDCR